MVEMIVWTMESAMTNFFFGCCWACRRRACRSCCERPVIRPPARTPPGSARLSRRRAYSSVGQLPHSLAVVGRFYQCQRPISTAGCVPSLRRPQFIRLHSIDNSALQTTTHVRPISADLGGSKPTAIRRAGVMCNAFCMVFYECNVP